MRLSHVLIDTVATEEIKAFRCVDYKFFSELRTHIQDCLPGYVSYHETWVFLGTHSLLTEGTGSEDNSKIIFLISQ